MANVFATHSVGNSLITFLKNSYPEALKKDHACDFRLLSSSELAANPDVRNTLTLYLYRITFNEHLRNSRRANDLSDAPAPLSIDLHYLLTVWNESALVEHTILTWAMLQFHMHPVLDASTLSPDAKWSGGDMVQVIPSELDSEEIFRIWDTLPPKYRLSVPYTARVVRIDYDPAAEGALPVVASRLSFTDREAEP